MTTVNFQQQTLSLSTRSPHKWDDETVHWSKFKFNDDDTGLAKTTRRTVRIEPRQDVVIEGVHYSSIWNVKCFHFIWHSFIAKVGNIWGTHSSEIMIFERNLGFWKEIKTHAVFSLRPYDAILIQSSRLIADLTHCNFMVTNFTNNYRVSKYHPNGKLKNCQFIIVYTSCSKFASFWLAPKILRGNTG